MKINWTPDAISTLLPLAQKTRTIANVGSYEAILLAQEKDYDGALETCRAILVAGRCNDPCHTLIQGLVRIAIQAVCLNQVERTLAQGEPSEAALIMVQNILEDELAQPILMQGFRGERATSYRAIEFAFKNPDDNGMWAAMGSAFGRQLRPLNKLWLSLLLPFMGSAESNQVRCLETLTELIDVMHRPELEQGPAFARLEAMSKDWQQPLLFRMLLPSAIKVYDAHLLSQARLRSAVAAIAAERYRRKHGSWPDTLDALVPIEVRQIGADPYNGQPLIFKRLADGLVIYSVGANGIDDGGLLGGADIGMRLWDVNQRRLEPVEPAVGEPKEK